MKETYKIKLKDVFLVLAIGITCLVFFGLCGVDGYSLERDSDAYTPFTNHNGVVLIYPVFLLFFETLFKENFLNVVVVAQAVISIVCSLDFIYFLKKEFSLNRIEVYITFLLSLLLYTIEFPEKVNSQMIMTEALAYPLFYLYVKFLLKAMWGGKKRDWIMNLVMALILMLVRSQLQLLWVISGLFIAFSYIRKRISKDNSHVRNWGQCCIALVIMGIVVIGGVKTGRTIDNSFDKAVWGEVKFAQSDSALFNRVSYFASEEDILLFEDEKVQKAVSVILQAIEETKLNDTYMPKDLWAWKHIATAATKNEHTAQKAIIEYGQNELNLTEDEAKRLYEDVAAEMGRRLLIKHPLKYLRDSIIMMPQGFICTAFIQKEAFYGICHLITLLLYLTAIMLAVFCIKRKELSAKAGEYMITVVIIACVFVVVTNLAFMGIQRYLYYTFGLFYIGYFLMLREIWRKIVKIKFENN